MESNEFVQLKKELEAIKNLIALQLRASGIGVESIGKALGVSAGRVSQMLGPGKNRKKAKSKK